MLSKIYSKVSRYSHGPAATPKIHQAKRSLNNQNNTNSRMVQLTNECLSALRRVQIAPSLQSAINSLQDTYYTDLQQMTEDEYKALPDHAIFEPDGSREALERAQAVQVYRGVGAVARFLEDYAVHTPGMNLCDAITATHQSRLLNSFHESFPRLSPSDQIALASAIHPDVISKLNLPCSDEGKRLSIATQLAGTPQLDEHHVIALLDYCNSSTGHFNAINDSKRIWQLCGIDTLASITSCISKPLDEGLQILSRYPTFVHKGPAWKGIALLEPAGPYRLSRIQPGMSYASPHWSSATHIENKNYSEKGDGYRTCKLSIAHAEGVHVHMFNDVTSINEGEVMLPPKPMYFTEDPKTDKRRSISAITIHCTMKSTLPEKDGNAVEPHAIRV
jgi:hypothetical protein